MEQPPSWNVGLGMALALIPICMWNPVFTNNSKDSRKQFNNQRKMSEENQLFLVYTRFLFFKEILLLLTDCHQYFSTLIPCQTTSCQCHLLQTSNNDVPSSLLYFCKARSFTQKNKYRWPIGRVCFVLILKIRLGKKKALLSVAMIIWSLPGSAWKDRRLSDLANKCQSHNFCRNWVTPKLLTS